LAFFPGDWVAHPHRQTPDPAFLSNRAGLGENLGTMPLDALERRQPPR
jgi:hypothetical protein